MEKLWEGFKQGSNKISLFLNHLHIFQSEVNFMAEEAFGERDLSLFSETPFVPLQNEDTIYKPQGLL